MKLNITNREIFFAVENCWESLPFKFQVQLYNLVKANDTEDFAQEVDIDADTFVKVMLAVNSQSQGISKDINPTMHLKLKTQILTAAQPVMTALSQLTDEAEIEAYKEEHKEILTIAERVQSILTDNLQMLENKILSGKERILG
jgi:hypothetical protein